MAPSVLEIGISRLSRFLNSSNFIDQEDTDKRNSSTHGGPPQLIDMRAIAPRARFD
jgi:hypothetical protein